MKNRLNLYAILFLSMFSANVQGISEEMIYLQTDKGIYETGEDLWFKTYTLDKSSLSLLGNSKTLYLEMLNENDSIVWQEKYPIQSGITNGHLYVDKNLSEGDYRIHAYTQYSFPNDTIRPVYPKKIRIVKNIANKGLNKEIGKESSVAQLSFFPEGGYLIDGIPSKVAFKALDGKGMPVRITGVLQENGKDIASLESIHDGMGSVSIFPRKKSSYKAVLSDGREFPFTEVVASGLSIHLRKQTDDYLEFYLYQSKGAMIQKIRLVGKMRGRLCCMATGTLHDRLKVKIPLKEFPMQGIAEFTLYNEDMQPVAERLVYVHPERKLHIELKTDNDRYPTRSKGKLNIKVTDETGNPVQAHLGLSIFDFAYQNEMNPENMLSYCYLSTEIKGNIHNPAYYFDETNKNALASLDLLLLTQGWRRYVWEKSDSVSNYFLSDEIHGVQTIRDKKMKEINGNSKQILQVFGPNNENEFFATDSLGRFTILYKQMERLRGGYIYVKSLLEKERYKPLITFEELFERADSIRTHCPFYISYLNPASFRNRLPINYPVTSQDSIILLPEVTITGNKGRVFRDKFMGRLDSLAQINFGPWVCSHGRLENYKVGYTHHHDPRYCPFGDNDEGKPRSTPVIGKRYHIVKYKYIGGRAFEVLDDQYVTYEGPLYTEEELLRMNNIWRVKGYYGKREFYQSDELDMQSPIPDARNVLLWKPDIITNEQGEAEVDFFCSDINTNFIGVVEGTDGIGNIGTADCEFRVMKYR